MSLCLEHGHPHAARYALGRLHDEAALIEERVNSRIITINELLKLAVGSMLSKKARTELSKQTKRLNVHTVPHRGRFEEGQ